MLGYGAPTAEDIKLQQMLEYGPLSPRTRMTIAAYMIEHGQGPADIGQDKFVESAQTALDFITGGVDELIIQVEELLPQDEAAQSELDLDEDEGKADDPIEDGYTYL